MSTTLIDPRTFRDTLAHFPSGLTVIAGRDGTEPIGFTCQSFYSVSIDPPLVSFCVTRTSTTYPRLARSGQFSVNVLAHHQTHLANQFARSGTDKWDGVEWTWSTEGNPLIADTTAWLDCAAWAEHEAGDHLIVIGQVLSTSEPNSCCPDPLLFFKSKYSHLASDAA